jgi:hypothetical protein
MDEQTKAMIQDMIKRGADGETIQAITGASQEDINRIAAEGKQGSLLDRLGIVNTAQASEMMPIEDLRTMPLGTQETFGEKLKPTIPTGGSIFTNRFENFNPRIGETGIQQVVSPYNFTGFNEDVLDEEEDAQYNLPEKSSIFSNILDAGLTYATGLPFVGKGLEYLRNQFENTPQYQRYTPGYNYGNLNPNLIDDFYDPATGLNRFDRAKTLFGQSRTLSEYLSKRRETAAAEAESQRIDAANKANVQSYIDSGGQSYDSQAQGTMYSDASSLGLE